MAFEHVPARSICKTSKASVWPSESPERPFPCQGALWGVSCRAMDQETRIERLIDQLTTAQGDPRLAAELKASPSFQRARAALSQAMRQLGASGGDGLIVALEAYPELLDQLEPAVQLARRPEQLTLADDLERTASKVRALGAGLADVGSQIADDPGATNAMGLDLSMLATPGTGLVSLYDGATAAGELARDPGNAGAWADLALSGADVGSELLPLALGAATGGLPALVLGGLGYGGLRAAQGYLERNPEAREALTMSPERRAKTVEAWGLDPWEVTP